MDPGPQESADPTATEVAKRGGSADPTATKVAKRGGSADPTATQIAARVQALVDVMDRLRSPGGCPWDARQTHRSLVEYLVEEAYEVVEAIESDDRGALREELGDLLLQVVFHSRIAEEDADDPWDFGDVAQGIADKLVARHPHVFLADDESGGALDIVSSAEDVEARWHRRKLAEKGRTSVTDGIPPALPALLLAAKLLARSESLEVGVPLEGEAAELVGSMESPDELGDLLLALVSAARRRGWDAEASVRDAARRHRVRVRAAEG